MAYLEAVKVHERERHKFAMVMWALRGKGRAPAPPKILTEE